MREVGQFAQPWMDGRGICLEQIERHQAQSHTASQQHECAPPGQPCPCMQRIHQADSRAHNGARLHCLCHQRSAWSAHWLRQRHQWAVHRSTAFSRQPSATRIILVAAQSLRRWLLILFTAPLAPERPPTGSSCAWRRLLRANQAWQQ